MTILSQSRTDAWPALDRTGKAVLDDIYNQTDPRPYFRALKPLDYSIPKFAHGYFEAIERHLAEIRQRKRLGIVDIGCSYGINGALLKLGISYDQFVENYTGEGVAGLGHEALLDRDRKLFNGDFDQGPVITGVDISTAALQYGVDAGFIDDRLQSNLEIEEIKDEDRARLENKDLVISTGCVGYVQGSTICGLIDGITDGASDNKQGARPWSAHFVLRMFPFDDVADGLARRGYETIAISGLFKQRKFVSFDEQCQIVEKIRAGGLDPNALESAGWFYAQLFLSVPHEDMEGARPLVDQLNSLSQM